MNNYEELTPFGFWVVLREVFDAAASEANWHITQCYRRPQGQTIGEVRTKHEELVVHEICAKNGG